LLEAAALQQKQPSELLELFPAQIASQASYLAYNLFTDEPNQCQIVLEVFDSYAALAKDKMLEELEYLYAAILKDCGQVDKSIELLQKIAEQSFGHWAEAAKLELIAQTIRGKKYEPQQINDLLERFKNSIAQSRDCNYALEAMHLLIEAVAAVEQFAKDDSGFVSNCKELARFCFDCLEGSPKQKAALLLIEVSAIQLPQQGALADFEQLLESLAEDNMSDDVGFIRCSARLAIAQQKFETAAKLWSKIAQITKDDTTASGARTWKWWRAKYYELYCWANYDPAQKQQIIHNIEVLQNSFSGIPMVWDEKLSRLKQEIK
jgi:tetratricopeptide (TPR) repeat protein